MLCRVALVRTDVSEERVASIISIVLRLLITSNVPSSPILVTQMMEAIRSSKASVLTKATRGHNPGDDIQSHRREKTQILTM
jgi:hypothetical protein